MSEKAKRRRRVIQIRVTDEEKESILIAATISGVSQAAWIRERLRNAFVTFETLNDRGLKVAQADLVKNFLFGQSEERLSEAQQFWERMFGALEVVEQEDITINFLRHICSALFGLTREREVFEKIRENVRGPFNAVAFLSNLAQYSSDYVAMLSDGNEKWNSYPPGIRSAIKTISLLNIMSIRPLMFAISHKFSPIDTERAFDMLISWTVRFFVGGGGTSGETEEAYSKAAKKIMDSEIKNCAQLLSEMSPFIATDTEFEEAFKNLRVSREYLARYYLRCLETVARNQPHPAWIPNEDTDAVNLEHVLPRSFQAHGNQLDEETAGAYLKRLGNLALLEAKKNNGIDNFPFSDKKPVLQSSTFKLTEMIGAESDWGIKQIKERQEKLAKLALKAWPLG